MKAIRMHNYGLSDELIYEKAPMPKINDNEVIVKVYATSVNHLDVLKGSGRMKSSMPIELPWIPGHDFSGIIRNVGENVKHLKVGDKVYGNCNGGSYAQYVVTDADKVAIKPEILTFVEAATVPHVGETAWQAIHTHGKLKEGEKVLIHGAAGAVGSFAVQFAHDIGAVVYATAAEEDEELLYSLGADAVIDYKTVDFTKVAKDMDLVLVLVGGDTQKRSYSVLKEGGRLVSTTGPILKEEAKLHKVKATAMVIKQSAEDLKKISKLIDEEKVQTDVAIVYDLQDAADAWKVFSGEDPSLPALTHGKIVLEVAEEVD